MVNPIGTDRAVWHDIRAAHSKLCFVLKRAEWAFYMQPKGIPRYLGNTFFILSRQTLLKISEIFDILRSKIFKMANKMAVQEVLDEIVADQDSGDSDFDDELGDFLSQILLL